MRKRKDKEIIVVERFPEYESEEAKQEALNELAYDIAVITAKHKERKENTA